VGPSLTNLGRASAFPLSAVLGSISSYPRPVIDRLIARLVGDMDEQDGDPDAERTTPPNATATPKRQGEHGDDTRSTMVRLAALAFVLSLTAIFHS
jgi:hypothetical protein